MNDRQPTYSKQVIEIADFVFSNPDKKVSEVLSYFVGKCRKTVRTVERYIKQAKEYNLSRIAKQEKAKDETIIDEAKKEIEKGILTRQEAAKILSDIAKGKPRPVPKEFQKNEDGGLVKDIKGNLIPISYDMKIPNDNERINAITKLADMSGWNAPIKNENVEIIQIGYDD